MDFYKGDIPVLDFDAPRNDLTHPPGASFGAIPRDYTVQPQGFFASPDEMEIIPASEHDARFDEQEATQSSLEHIYLSGPNGTPRFVLLDQNGFPDCWCHSTAHAIMMDRLKQNLPIVRLNAVAVATLLKRTNGGWAGLSCDFAGTDGYPVVGNGPGQWPYQSRRGKDTPELRASMALHKVTENWVDLTRPVYNRNLTDLQRATCSFNNIVGAEDFNWWGHSVARLRWVRIEKGSWGPLILNSWVDPSKPLGLWGRYGLAVLRGSQARADGAIAIRMTTASAA